MLKKITISILAICLFMNCPIASHAKALERSKVYSEVPTIGEPAPDLNYGSGLTFSNSNTLFFFSTESEAGFKGGSCSCINADEKGVVRGYAQTMADYKVDEIGYKLYFQIWDGYEWTDIESKKNSDTNAREISEIYDKSVIIGKYYRVRVEHYTINNGTKYTAKSVSKYVLAE